MVVSVDSFPEGVEVTRRSAEHATFLGTIAQVTNVLEGVGTCMSLLE
jgi:hypothetical protein